MHRGTTLFDRSWDPRMLVDIEESRERGVSTPSRSAAEYRPEADGDEADAGDEAENLRLHQPFDLSAEHHPDRRGDHQRRRAPRENDPAVGLPFGREEHGGQLGLVADLG